MKQFFMITLAVTLSFFSSCQREEKDEDRSVNTLMEESEGSFQETVKDSKEMQKEVNKLNSKIKRQSQQQVQKIDNELQDEKKK